CDRPAPDAAGARWRPRTPGGQARAPARSSALEHTPLGRGGTAMLLANRKILVTGVLSEASIATSVARLAQEQGADVVLTSFGRALSLTQRVAQRLPRPAAVVELDVTRPDHLAGLTADLERRWGRLDAVLHAIGYAPPVCLSGDFLAAGWEDVGTALHVSAYSLKSL